MTMLAEFSAFQVAGLAGVLIFAAAIAAVQFGLVDGRRPAFCSVTALAAVAVLGSNVEAFNLYVALISGLVLMASLISLTCRMVSRRRTQRSVNRWVEQNWMAQHISSR